MSESGRFKVVDTPAMMPGECWLTRTTVGPFIDTGLDVPFEKRGRVYIALDILREMAFEAGLFEGLVPSTEVEKAYANGVADATKENIGGELGGIATRVRLIADRLDALRVDDAAPVEAARAGD